MSTDTSRTAANDIFEEELTLYWKQHWSWFDADTRAKSRDARLLQVLSAVGAKKSKTRKSGRKRLRKRILKGRLDIVRDGSGGR